MLQQINKYKKLADLLQSDPHQHISLDISFDGCNIGPRGGAESLSQFLKSCTNLTSLDLNLNRNNILDKGLLSLATGLGQLTNLISLSLNLQSNYVYASNIPSFCTEIAKCLNLEYLDLDFGLNHIGTQGAQSFAEFANFQSLKSLKINLESNYIYDEGSQILGKALRQIKNLTSLTLNLKSNCITNDGITELVEFLANNSLISLDLDLSGNKIQEVSVLGQALKKCKNLQSIGLYLNDLWIENIGLGHVCDVLNELVLLKSLKLSLQQCNLTNENMNFFIEPLAKCVLIKELNIDLSQNKIGLQGASGLVKIIKQSPNITTLHLNLKFNLIRTFEDSRTLDKKTFLRMKRLTEIAVSKF